MPKYKIKHTSIMHNGKICSEGSVIELTEQQAKRLEDFVTLVPEKKTTTPATQTKKQNQTNSKNKTKNFVETKPETKTEVKEGGTNDK